MRQSRRLGQTYRRLSLRERTFFRGAKDNFVAATAGNVFATKRDSALVDAQPGARYRLCPATGRNLIAACAVVIGTWCGLGERAAGQNAPRVREHIILPPQYGATVASTIIFAQASYVAAMGDFMESAANARSIHAEAAEHEMRNALLWTEIYFKRRQLNRAFRAEENPGFLEKEKKRQKTVRDRIINAPQLALAGDPSDELNWLLHEMAGLPDTKLLLPGGHCLAHTATDRALRAGALRQLWLTDGGAGEKRLLFRASEAGMLTTRQWPGVLKEIQFDEARRHFETVRDAAVTRIAAEKEISRQTEHELMEATDRLWAVFNAVYPVRRQQAVSPRQFVAYLQAERHLESLARAVFRLIETDDPRVFDGSFRFQGKTVIELINHMWSYGLEFAPPQSGGEGAYRALFDDMRAIYLAVGGGKPPAKQK